jgi:AGZA family xanthine/uracil permease-like MFS transporter
MLSSSFIITSLLWAWALAAAIDRRLILAAKVFLLAGILTLFGAIHSPLAGNQLFVPFGPSSWGNMVIDPENRAYVLEFAAGYLASAVLLFVWSMTTEIGSPITDEEH